MQQEVTSSNEQSHYRGKRAKKEVQKLSSLHQQREVILLCKILIKHQDLQALVN